MKMNSIYHHQILQCQTTLNQIDGQYNKQDTVHYLQDCLVTIQSFIFDPNIGISIIMLFSVIVILTYVKLTVNGRAFDLDIVNSRDIDGNDRLVHLRFVIEH